MLKTTLAAGLVASLMSFAPSSATAQSTEIAFGLDFIALGRHAPWYVALEKGFFEEEGLSVEIVPSRGTAEAIRNVLTGIVDIGLIDVPSLVAAGSAASDIQIVHGAYVEAPYCIFSLDPGANLRSPEDLSGIRLGSSSASFVPRVWAAFMAQQGIDADPFEIVNIDPAGRVPMLVQGEVDAIDLFVMSEPAIRRAAEDAQPVCMFAADFGLGLYSNSIGVTRDMIDENPETIRAFVRAAMRGWQYTMANRDEAADIMVSQLPALNRDVVREEIDIIERVGINDSVMANGFGYIDPARFAETVAFINDNADVTGTPRTAEDILVSGFAPTEPFLP